MSDAVIVAVVTGVLTLVGVIISTRATRDQIIDKMDKQSALSDAKLEQEIAIVKTELNALAAEVHKHNGFAERIPALEEKAKSADRRLTDLEHKG